MSKPSDRCGSSACVDVQAVGCGTGHCVDVVQHGHGVIVSSTIEGNDAFVPFTQAEWDAFGDAVKAGKWDHTFSGTREDT